MTKDEYELKKQEIINRLGKPEYDYDRTALNESAKEMQRLAGDRLAYDKAIKKQAKMDAMPYEEKEKLGRRLSSLNEITLLDEDLQEFKGVDKDIVRDHFTNRHASAKTLGHRYNKSYQHVAGLLKSRAVNILKAKYFNETLSENTQIALIKLTQDADPKIVLEAAKYLQLLTNKQAEEDNGSKKICDPVAQNLLSTTMSWFIDGMQQPLTLDRSMFIQDKDNHHTSVL